ncbi:hypothetical protein [Pseudomonas aeruginosa]|uniref:hypothetical protein n=1 Tax=Pseudomonas aeruginosa TaxID=287 RepID=UPI001CD6ACC8|nr:hypothetical protein [Pseudomonas aeruginosa]HCL4294684.1 hypothetical protein [Pseudomonas aeruginosa]
MNQKIIPADRGWHVVTIARTPNDSLSICEIHKITHWSKSTGHPMQDGKQLYFDPDDIRHVLYATYLMDPLGRLLGRDREVIANSILDLHERYKVESVEMQRRHCAAHVVTPAST